jgi:iron complex outermembrane receptor protein
LTGDRQATVADSTGRFTIGGIRPGTYILEVTSVRWGRALQRVVVETGSRQDLAITLLPHFHLEDIVVSAGGNRQRSEIAQATDVKTRDDLVALVEPSLGETLSKEAGINSSYFGPGASRPIIRGLQGDRVRVLESGIGVGDASSTSPDHAVSIEPGSAERIEIIRGPATLLYGSAAIGGVVNVINRRPPRDLPHQALSGEVALTGASAANELNGAMSITGNTGGVVVRLDGLARNTDDYRVPSLSGTTTLESSKIESLSGAVGISYVANRGYIGAAVKGFRSKYGVPGGHGEHEEEEETEEAGGVSIDLDQVRTSFEGEYRFASGVFEGLNARVGLSDYEHAELEGAEVGTRILSNAWEARVEGPHSTGGLSGTVGLQFGGRDFEAIGDEAFVPPTSTDTWAAFLFESYQLGRLTLQGGARFERHDVVAKPQNVARDFDGVSWSAGVTWTPVEALGLTFAAGRSVKMPNAEELYSDGPHAATRSFEIGDPNLSREIGYNVEAGVRLLRGPVTGEVVFFANDFDNFIFATETDSIADGLPVFQYTQLDALYTGFELNAEVELLHRGPHHVGLEVLGDYVRAEARASEEPLPRIPPFRLGGGIDYEGSPWRAAIHIRGVRGQDRVATAETVTPGYTMLDASVSYRIFTSRLAHELSLRGTNLTNQLARVHTSFLKDEAPLPGRDVRFMYRLLF